MLSSVNQQLNHRLMWPKLLDDYSAQKQSLVFSYYYLAQPALHALQDQMYRKNILKCQYKV
jgi:hypothetical protein